MKKVTFTVEIEMPDKDYVWSDWLSIALTDAIIQESTHWNVKVKECTKNGE